MYNVTKGVESFDVRIANNGFMITYNGHDDNDNWSADIIVTPDMDGLVKVIERLITLPKE